MGARGLVTRVRQLAKLYRDSIRAIMGLYRGSNLILPEKMLKQVSSPLFCALGDGTC